MEQGKKNVVDQALLVDEKPGYTTKETHLNEVKQNLDKKSLQERGMAPINDQVHSVVEEEEYKPGKFLSTNKAQEIEGFQSPVIRLTTKRKPIPEDSPLWFQWGELQKRSQSSEQRLVSSHTVGNSLNTYSSIENIKRDKKHMPALSESHTNPNLGVTMRGKERLFVTDSRIVVFWGKEVKKSSSYDS